ncbi:hypothetical protein Tco_1429202 [Tanacetum coccineum]
MDDPNITMKEYIRLEEEKARRRGKVYNWETTTYGKIWDNEDVYDLRSVETEFPAIVFNDTLKYEATLSCEPTKSETSLSKCDEEEENVLYFNDLFHFNVIYPDDSKSDKDNDDDEIDIKQSLGDNIVYTAYPNPMDTAYRLSGCINTTYPVEWIRRIDFYTVLGPHEGKSTNVVEVFTSLEVLES